MNLNGFVEKRFSLLMLAGLVLLLAFFANFFLEMSAPGYWHSGEIGTYMTHSFFAIDQGFLAEIPYWHHGYNFVPSALYQPMLFLSNAALFHAGSFLGFESIYWTYFASLMLSYLFAFVVTWKMSKRNLLVFLLTVGNFVSLGLFVIVGATTKIFAFNICFPGVIYLLDKRNSLEMTWKEIAGFSVLMAAVFVSHFFIFIFFALLYLGVILQNKKARLRGLIPFAIMPILTLPYLLYFVPAMLNALKTPLWASPIGLFNVYTMVFVAFLLLCAIVREWYLVPIAALVAIVALGINRLIPTFTIHSLVFLCLAIIFYYAANYDLKRFGLGVRTGAWASKGPGGWVSKGSGLRTRAWASRQNILALLLFALLALNFFYFAPRIEKANLFYNQEYRELAEYGEFESVFFLADLAKEDEATTFLTIYLTYQTFTYRNYSTNAWWPLGDSHLKFSKDREIIVQALREGDCETINSMAEKLGLQTIVVKNLPESFSCSTPIDAEIGKFKVLKP